MFFSLNIKPEQVSLKNAIFTPLVTFEKLSRRQAMPGRRVCKGNSTLYSHWRNAHGSISYLPPCQELNTRPLPFSQLWQSQESPLQRNPNPAPCPCAGQSPFQQHPEAVFRDASCAREQNQCGEASPSVHWRNCNHFLCKTMDYWFKIGFLCPTSYDQVHFIVILHWLINSWSPRTALFSLRNRSSVRSKLRVAVPKVPPALPARAEGYCSHLTSVRLSCGCSSCTCGVHLRVTAWVL